MSISPDLVALAIFSMITVRLRAIMITVCLRASMITLMIDKLSNQKEGLQKVIESTKHDLERERNSTYKDTIVPLHGQDVNASVQYTTALIARFVISLQ